MAQYDHSWRCVDKDDNTHRFCSFEDDPMMVWDRTQGGLVGIHYVIETLIPKLAPRDVEEKKSPVMHSDDLDDVSLTITWKMLTRTKASEIIVAARGSAQFNAEVVQAYKHDEKFLEQHRGDAAELTICYRKIARYKAYEIIGKTLIGCEMIFDISEPY